MNNSNFSKISVIVPLRNDCLYLLRLLKYFESYNFAAKILILDSSSDENKRVNIATISSFPLLDISLNHYPNDILFMSKVTDAPNHVITKYSVFCAADDFLTPNGIFQCVRFLEENPDFAVADGYYIRFWLELDSVGVPVFVWKSIYPHKSITFPDAKSRLSYYLPNYRPSFYAVHRTEILKLILTETGKYTTDYRFGELLPATLATVYGKMQHMDVLCYARDYIPAAFYPARPKLKDFIKDGSYEKRYADFCNCLAMHLSAKEQMDVREAKKVVDEAMFLYFTSHVMSNKMKDEKTRLLHKQRSLKEKEINANFEHSTRAGFSKYHADLERIRSSALAGAITIYKPGLKEIASTLVG